MIEAGADPEVHGFTLRHVPQALSTLATAAGLDPSAINPFLTSAGIGLTASGQQVESPARLSVGVSKHGTPQLDVKTLDKEKARKVTPSELRRLLIEFQESLP